MNLLEKLHRPVDNAPLVAFRILFGLLLMAESFGAILTGWVTEQLIDPEFTFSHIGFEWLQPLPGNGMYFYFVFMGILGGCVMLGYKYRLTLGLFTVLWTGVYLMQKTAYNNHYYLLILVCVLMWLSPAHRYASVDVRQNPSLKSLVMPDGFRWMMILQMGIVYFYATVAKLYPDWLNGKFISILLQNRNAFPPFDTLFANHYFHLFLSWSGLVFDLLVVVLLLFPRTRTWAFIASIVFHLFNAATLHIGIFPFFALSFILFFYPPDKIRQWFFKRKPPAEQCAPFAVNKLLTGVLAAFFALQVALPLRHVVIPGDVLWTEEGHRLSWRMMLRQRHGTIHFRVVDKRSEQEWRYPLDHLPRKHLNFVSNKPDGIWQMAQRIKHIYAEKGISVAVYADCFVSVNGSEYARFIDPNVDLAAAPYHYFGHSAWILHRE